jgi:hypothetical protein
MVKGTCDIQVIQPFCLQKKERKKEKMKTKRQQSMKFENHYNQNAILFVNSSFKLNIKKLVIKEGKLKLDLDLNWQKEDRKTALGYLTEVPSHPEAGHSCN